jgi:hypothetical protein
MTMKARPNHDGLHVTMEATRDAAIECAGRILNRLHGEPVSIHISGRNLAACILGVMEIFSDGGDPGIRVTGPQGEVVCDPNALTGIQDMGAYHGPDSGCPVSGALFIGEIDPRLIETRGRYEITRTAAIADGDESGTMVPSRVIFPFQVEG